jgi:hypothetical protein
MEKNESINCYGKKVSVKAVGAYYDRNHLRGNFYLFYDEDEVYHIEEKTTKEIAATFSAASYSEAFKKAIAILDKGPLSDLRCDILQFMVKVLQTEEKYLPRSEQEEIHGLVNQIDEILKFNDNENKKVEEV